MEPAVLMTHALPPEIRLNQVPAHAAATFERIWEAADRAADHQDLTTYAFLHTQAANAIGIELPASGELARCTCPGCWNCDTVFDADQAHTHMDGTVEFVQCPGCWDDHPRTGDE